MAPATILAVARLGRAYGVRGWIHVVSAMEPPESLLEFDTWQLRGRDGWYGIAVVSSQHRPNGLVAKLAGVDSREDARALAGVDVGVAREALPPTDDDEFYWVDLLGAQVRTSDGRVLGEVSRLLETGTHDVMEVRSCTHEMLIPFVLGKVVTSVDIDAKDIVVDWEFSDEVAGAMLGEGATEISGEPSGEHVGDILGESSGEISGELAVDDDTSAGTN